MSLNQITAMNADLDLQFAAAARAAIDERRARFAAEIQGIRRTALRDGCASALPRLTAGPRARLDRDLASIFAHLPAAVRALVIIHAPCPPHELPVQGTRYPAQTLAAA